MKLIKQLQLKAKSLKQQLTAVYYASLDPRVGLFPKILIAVAIGYTLSPIDLIPDFIPVLGLLDDLLIVPALITWAIRLVPKEVMEEARREAESAPLTLSKNWFFGAVFIGIWVGVLFSLGAFVAGHWGIGERDA